MGLTLNNYLVSKKSHNAENVKKKDEIACEGKIEVGKVKKRNVKKKVLDVVVENRKEIETLIKHADEKTKNSLEGGDKKETDVPIWSVSNHRKIAVDVPLILNAEKRYLRLPNSLKILERFFFSLESVCVFNKIRDVQTIFHRVIKPIENVFRRKVSVRYLQEVLYFYPESYEVTPWKIDHMGKETVSYILCMKNCLDSPTNQELFERKKILHTRILKHIYNIHNKWCMDKGEAVLLFSEIKRWHPGFNIEDIPEIPIKSLSSMKEDCQEKKHHEFTTRAVEKEGLGDGATIEKNRNLSLLERIREKERLNNVKIMKNESDKGSGDVGTEKIEAIVDIISNYGTFKGKSVFLMGDLVNTIISTSRKPISRDAVVDIVKMLASRVPRWISVTMSDTPLTKGTFVKLNRSMAVKEVKDLLRGT